MSEEEINNIVIDLGTTGYIPEIVKHEAIRAIEMLDEENERLKKTIKKIKAEIYKNQFEFTFYGCWLNIKGILESEMN